ncbi:MAG: PDZ domain-containing protein [Microbacteriaceae bacterium]|nr:PDZ domain-containing protein [Microbacteriaceae bacterium]
MTDTLLYILGIIIIVAGLALSIGLHEFGHLIPAKLFGVRVPTWAIGFGPKLYSKKIGETEYSLRAIPLGGFITLIGMYPPAKEGKDDSKRWFSASIIAAREAHSEHIQAGDENRKFYQLAAWKRIVVMFGGPFMNLVLGLAMVSVALSGIGEYQRVNTVAQIVECEAQMVDPASKCASTDVPTPAAVAGFKPGDEITAVDGEQIARTQDPFVKVVEQPNDEHVLAVIRDGKTIELRVTPKVGKLPYADATGILAVDASGKPLLKDRAYIGLMLDHARVPASISESLAAGTQMTGQTLGFIVQFPQQVYASVSSLFSGAERSPNGAVSIVGITQLAGEVNANSNATLSDRIYLNLMLLGSLNLALFAFNMIPLPPLDGGHIAGGIYEYAKRGLYRLLGRPDPGIADTALLAPVANLMFLILMFAGLAMIIVDLIKPIVLG